MSRTKVLAIISGLLVGAFLDLRLSPPGPSRSWEWYQVALLLGGIGLGGVFPAAWLWGPIGMAAARFLMFFVKYHSPSGLLSGVLDEETTLALLFILMAVPAPLIGGTISRLLSRKPIPRFFYFAALASTVAVGAAATGQSRARSRDSAQLRDRLDAEGMPALLKRIYEAEMAYSTGRRDRSFACDGDQLPGREMGALEWSNGLRSTIRNRNILYTQRGKYTLRLECPDTPSPVDRFRVTAYPHIPEPSSPTLTIDQTGELTELASTKAPRAPPPTHFVQIVGVSLEPGASVPPGRPYTFRLEILYDISFADSAFLVIRVAQFSKGSTGCSGDDGELTDAAEVPITYGTHTVKLDVPWSGDTGQATRRRMNGRGFLSFAPSIWEDNAGHKGKYLDDLGVYRDICYSFGR
jgi:hypothetical protein